MFSQYFLIFYIAGAKGRVFCRSALDRAGAGVYNKKKTAA